ncbi:MAG: sensor histidine kinase [Flammeovirgaceae bacterium]
MKKPNSIRWTIILMAIAMMALIGFQFNWIYRDMRLNKANFERNAKFALNSVLESYLEHQITSGNHFVFTTDVESFSVDSLTEFYFNTTTPDTLHKPNIKIKTSGFIHSATKTTIRPKKHDNDVDIVEVTQPEGESIQIVIENIERDENGNKVVKRVYRDNKLINETFEEPSTAMVDIQVGGDGATNKTKTWAWSKLHKERANIDFEFLKHEMKEALEKQGLNLAYLFGVYHEEKDEILFQNVAKQHASILPQSEFRTPLVGNQSNSDGKLLLLHFPNKNEFLLKELAGVFFTSIALIAIVATCFWFAIRTILRQKKLSDIKNDFINNMTHEFKTPISNVSLAIEALQSFGMMAKPETTQKYLEIAKKENNRLGKQVEKVLQMALLEKEEFKLKIKSISLHEVIEQVVDSFKLQVEQKGGWITPNLQATNDLLEADELHLTNVLFNLVDNANKYSPEKPEITIHTENTDAGLKIAVMDKGIGIAKDHLQRIFQKFYRVPTGNVHNVKGFGLGLSYVGQIVQRHHGTISVSSKNQEGSRFEILLPYKQG